MLQEGDTWFQEPAKLCSTEYVTPQNLVPWDPRGSFEDK